MKNLVKLTFALCLFSGSLFADSLEDLLPEDDRSGLYAGLEYQHRAMGFKEGFGNNLMKKNFPQGNIYVGFKLTDQLGIEGGHESTVERQCCSTLLAGECCAGRHVPHNLSPAVFRTKLRLKGPHINFIYFYPVQDYPVKLLGSVGITSVKATAQVHAVRLGPHALPGATRTLSKHKAALRFMGGAQYLNEGRLGFRATISFVRTGKIVVKKDDDHPSIHIPKIKLKDSIVYGLGAFWEF